MAVARVAAAQSTGTTSYDPGTASTAPGNPYAGSQTYPTTVARLVSPGTVLAFNGVFASGGFVVTDTGGGLTAQYVYSPGGSTSVMAGPTFNMASYVSANSNPQNNPTGASFQSSNGAFSQTFEYANPFGSVAGSVSRYIPGMTLSAGTDAYLYIPTVQDAVSRSSIVIGNQGTLGRINAANAADGTVYYAFNTSQAVTGQSPTPYTQRQLTVPFLTGYSATSTPTGLNANNQMIIQASRYLGVNTTGENGNLGTDAFLFTPATDGSATGTVAQVGLTGQTYGFYNANGPLNALVVTNAYAGSTSAYQTSASAPVALNNAGAVIGTTNRYQAITAAPTAANFTTTTSSSGTRQGTDAWLYSGATSLGAPAGTTPIGTVQVGLVGTGGAALGGYYAVTTSVGISETSAVNGVSSAGAVTGTSTVYLANTSAGTAVGTSLGVDAWQFKPTLVGGSGPATATGFGTTAAGTYTQVGLTTPATATGPGYQTSGGLRMTTVSVVNAAGNAAGTSVRYATSASTTSSNSFGADAWYFNGSSTTLITPTANASYSNYVRSDGYSNATVSTTSMSAAGVVAGTQARYAPNSTTAAGADVWAYSPLTNNTYVIASPAIVANDADFAANRSSAGPTEYFNATVTSVSDNGLVIGTLVPSPGSSGGTTLGTFVYAWTQQAGTVVLGSTTSTSNMIAALTLNSSSGTASISTSSIYADAAGDIFGLGSSTTSGMTEIFEFAAAPEPTSLALLGLALTPLAGRRRRRSPGPTSGTAGLPLLTTD